VKPIIFAQKNETEDPFNDFGPRGFAVMSELGECRFEKVPCIIIYPAKNHIRVIFGDRAYGAPLGNVLREAQPAPGGAPRSVTSLYEEELSPSLKIQILETRVRQLENESIRKETELDFANAMLAETKDLRWKCRRLEGEIDELKQKHRLKEQERMNPAKMNKRVTAFLRELYEIRSYSTDPLEYASRDEIANQLIHRTFNLWR